MGASFGGIAQATAAFYFVVSAVLKLARPESASDALAAFGIGRRARVATAIALAAAELAVGATLLALRSAWVLAPPLALLAVFSAALLYLKLRAPGVRCGCLGDLGSDDHATGLARNACLALLAGVAIANEPVHLDLSTTTAALQLTLVLVVCPEGLRLLRAMRAFNRSVEAPTA